MTRRDEQLVGFAHGSALVALLNSRPTINTALNAAEVFLMKRQLISLDDYIFSDDYNLEVVEMVITFNQ